MAPASHAPPRGRPGHTPIIKPKPLKPAIKSGHTLDDFTADEATSTLTCPNDITRPTTPKHNLTFGTPCRTYPLRDHCTTNKTNRTLTLHPHDALLHQTRTD